MGAHRKTQTFTISERSGTTPPQLPNFSVSSRGLSIKNLGGVIFGCKQSTMRECLLKQIFGLPSSHSSYVSNIRQGLPLFLFNYTDRKFHGIFEAASNGQLNIDPYCWTENGEEKTPYPAQVRIRISIECKSLDESQFRDVIADNYYTTSHFWFELDHAQVEGLKTLFVPGPSGFSKLATKSSYHQPNTSKPNAMTAMIKSSAWDDDANDKAVSLNASSNALGDDEVKPNASDWDSQCLEHVIAFPHLGKNQTLLQNDEDAVLDKLKKIAMNRAQSNSNITEEFSCPTVDIANGTEVADCPEALISHTAAFVLMGVFEEMKALVLQQDEQNKALKKKQLQLDEEFSSLKERVKELEYKVDPSLKQVDESLTESLVEQYLGSDNVIYLVGGFDGETWSSALDSYAPSHDVLTPLRPMSFARSYASAVALGGSLYVLGGRVGARYCRTVECYNPRKDEWILCTPLNREKGNLAGATLHNKIFAIGGGNAFGCFPDVEVFDPTLDRWIDNQEMHQKRYGHAAAELNGALYVVGGCDGMDYLKTAERLDPRDPSWTKLPNMNSSRCSHSVAVLNDKLYALGGHSGSNMLSTVEVFDPRASSWMMVEPMNEIRGCAGIAVLGSSIFAMGGLRDGVNIVESVELYKEGVGWRLTESRAIKRRCNNRFDFNQNGMKMIRGNTTSQFIG
ncbi:hypothetical protein QJS10_CPA03g01039 [Acorus calamus]|uniref:DCD domain-containing protein n=1 Tax=Acorus calamus TaxID=4465 RepID=A0AAV9F8Z0_ACOCL|nr:hypothetical protein QJS10_CPA03g01039 [Acorus calamus]